MTVCFRYLPLEEALSRYLSTVSSSQEVVNTEIVTRGGRGHTSSKFRDNFGKIKAIPGQSGLKQIFGTLPGHR